MQVACRGDECCEWGQESGQGPIVRKPAGATHCSGGRGFRKLLRSWLTAIPLHCYQLSRGRRKAREGNIDPATRAADERAAKTRYALQLYNFLVEAKAPIVKILQEVSDPEEACVRIFGTRRSKTLRNRYHSWVKFARWLETSKGRTWPAGLEDLLDYATECVKEGAGKTVIDAFAASLSVLEQVGKFEEGQMFSKDNTWISYSKNVTAELVEKGPTLHQAAQPTVAMALSLELFLGDTDRPKYARAMSFVALIMLWGSMRADDVQCVRPESMRLTIEGFACKLWKTKTTGPDRRVNIGAGFHFSQGWLLWPRLAGTGLQTVVRD